MFGKVGPFGNDKLHYSGTLRDCLKTPQSTTEEGAIR